MSSIIYSQGKIVVLTICVVVLLLTEQHKSLFRSGYPEQASRKGCDCNKPSPLRHDNNDSIAPQTPSPSPPLLSPLRDIHIVMIGDSLMRYQYLSLAYRLRYGIWFHESQWYYNLVSEATFQDPYHDHTWGEFLYHTNRLLQPYEVCDCRRNPKVPFFRPEIIENRYFYDPVHNNSITFLLAFGHQFPVKGRLAPDQVRSSSKLPRDWQMKVFKDFTNYTWRRDDWSDIIQQHVRYLDPQPRHIILNAGFWPHNFGHTPPPPPVTTLNTSNETLLQRQTPRLKTNDTERLVRVVQELPQYQFIWKTTTYRRDREGTSNENDEIMCELLTRCFNVSFTRHVRQELFWDNKHFLEPVYRYKNEEMLEQLGYLPSDYVRMNISDILE